MSLSFQAAYADFEFLCSLDIVGPFASAGPDLPALHCDKPRIKLT